MMGSLPGGKVYDEGKHAKFIGEEPKRKFNQF